VNGVTPVHENNAPPAAEVVSTTIVDGSSDKPLKEAANDPATHEIIEKENGISELAPPPNASSKSTPKRKEVEAADEPDPKKQKTDSTEVLPQVSSAIIAGSPKRTTQDVEESEEGELEE
jgi:hypothetical protein